MPAIKFQQTDITAGEGCAVGTIACAGGSVTSETPQRTVLYEEGAAAGSNELTVTIGNGESLVVGMNMALGTRPGSSGQVALHSGTHIFRLNVTSSGSNLTLEEVHICRVTQGCSNQESLGSTTGIGESLGSTGVKEVNITQSGSSTLAATEKIIYICKFTNSHDHANRSFGYTQDQLIDTPYLRSDASGTPSIALLTASGAAELPKEGSGTPSIAGPTTSGVAIARSHLRTASGTPQLEADPARIVVIKRNSGGRLWPPQPLILDKQNFFGSRCNYALLPGQDIQHSGAPAVRDVPRNIRYFLEQVPSSGSTATSEPRIITAGHLGAVPAMFMEPVDDDDFLRWVSPDPGMGSDFNGPLPITVFALFIPTGNGIVGGSTQSYIWSLANPDGSPSADLYITTLAAGGDRIQVGARLSTLRVKETSFGSLKPDALNLAVLSVGNSALGTEISAYILNEDGFATSSGGDFAETYSPRLSLNAAGIGGELGTSSQSDHPFAGGLIGVWAFRGLSLRESVSVARAEKIIRRFWANPWQTFEQRPRLMVPVLGQALLPASGTATTPPKEFASGTPSIAIPTTSGAAKVRKSASGTPTVSGTITLTVVHDTPRTDWPDVPTEFNKANYFGSKCVWAMIPGWGHVDNFSGSVKSSGHKLNLDASEVGTGSSFDTATVNAKRIGGIRTISSAPVDGTNFGRLSVGAGRHPPFDFPSDQFTIIAIIKPNGDGLAPGQTEACIFAKALGSATADFDLKLGLGTATGVTVQTRVRQDTTVREVTIGGISVVIQNDALNFMALEVTIVGSGGRNRGYHLTEEGNFIDGSIQSAGVWNPRTTTSLGLYGNPAAASEPFDGEILGIWAFDNLRLSEALCRNFFADPSQVFKGQRILIPIEKKTSPLNSSGSATIASPLALLPRNIPVPAFGGSFHDNTADELLRTQFPTFDHTGTYTISFWVRVGSDDRAETTRTWIAGANTDGGNAVWAVSQGVSTNGLILSQPTNEIVLANGTVIENKWQYCTVSRNGTDSFLSLDSISGTTADDPIQVGNWLEIFGQTEGGVESHSANIDLFNLKIWDTYLTEPERQDEKYRYEPKHKRQSLIGWYPLDQDHQLKPDIGSHPVWSRTDGADILWRVANPQQVFREQKRLVALPPSAGGPSASGTPSITIPTTSGAAKVHKTASGTPSIPLITTSGAALVAKPASGTPTLTLITSSGAAKVTKVASGTPSTGPPTASGVVAISNPRLLARRLRTIINLFGVAPHAASGSPSITIPTASGAAKVRKPASGTPSITIPTASGAAKVHKVASGTPSITIPTASGAAKVHKVASGTPSITAVTASGRAQVQPSPTLRRRLLRTWLLLIKAHAASGTPTITIPTASGAAKVHKVASGTPSITVPTASGAAKVHKVASGSPSIPLITASGAAKAHKKSSGSSSIPPITASGRAEGSELLRRIQRVRKVYLLLASTAPPAASGTPSITIPTASGAAKVRKPASGAPSIVVPTASGAAKVAKKSSGTLFIPVVTASGRSEGSELLRRLHRARRVYVLLAGTAPPAASGTPSIAIPTASGAAKVAKKASGTPSIALLTASGAAKVRKPASGTPSIAIVTASGAAKVHKSASGTPSITLPTALGRASVSAPAVLVRRLRRIISLFAVAPVAASGTPSIAIPTASGEAKAHKLASGAPSIALITASGAAQGQIKASGTPSIALITASGAAKVHKVASGTPSIAAILASGAAAVSNPRLLLRRLRAVWGALSAIVVHAASGTPTVPAVTASGAAKVHKTASGTPSIAPVTASGAAKVRKPASGTPSIPLITASGTAVSGGQSASGTPTMPLPTASGTATQPPRGSGATSIAIITASGTAETVRRRIFIIS